MIRLLIFDLWQTLADVHIKPISSLRSGLVTSAAMADVPEHVIMKQTRHVSSATVRGYIREGQIFKKNAAAAVGL